MTLAFNLIIALFYLMTSHDIVEDVYYQINKKNSNFTN